MLIGCAAYVSGVAACLMLLLRWQVYVDGEFIGGSDILMDLHRNGELEAMLQSGTTKTESA